MRKFFHDLFDYNHDVNTKIINVLNEHPDLISDKSIALFSHILNAHRIWNYRIQEGRHLYERWETHLVEDCYAINKENYEESINILKALPLDQTVQYTMSTGQVCTSSIKDVLFHVINHSTYHRAQLATEFKQIGLTPLLTDYILYKMK